MGLDLTKALGGLVCGDGVFVSVCVCVCVCVCVKKGFLSGHANAKESCAEVTCDMHG